MKPRIVSFGFALVLGISLSLSPAQAQTAPNPTQPDLHDLELLSDQVKAALQKGDLDSAQRLSSDLMTGIFKQRKAVEPAPQAKFLTLEKALPLSGRERFYALANVAKAAFDAGELDKADRYGRELLSTAPEYQKDWNYGNAVFYGNMMIGRVALKRDHNMLLASSSLIASGKTTGSPQLNSFGPSMSLAKDLLTVGERDTVLEFLTLCRSFWKMHPERLDDWTAAIKGGGTPDFLSNLAY